MVSILQVVVVLFVLFALSRVILRFKDKNISVYGLLFWLLVWLGVTLVLFIPSMTQPIARLLNIGRGIDVAVYLSIVLLFYLVFRIYIKIDKTEHEITKLVREIAIKKKK